eukprot:4389091-Heterocapsa_arctica.AAC.1
MPAPGTGAAPACRRGPAGSGSCAPSGTANGGQPRPCLWGNDLHLESLFPTEGISTVPPAVDAPQQRPTGQLPTPSAAHPAGSTGTPAQTGEEADGVDIPVGDSQSEEDI